MSYKEVNSERRQDWHETSTGVGHHYRPGYYFPSSLHQTHEYQPIPPSLAKADEVNNTQKYMTMTGDTHDNKFGGRAYKNPTHIKAPGHWNVHYVKDHVDKLGKGGWKKPLTMGNQMSETSEQFQAKPGIKEEYAFENIFGKQPFLLYDHVTDGPSKLGQATTQNPKLQGQAFFVRDKEVFKLNDPYLSTTHRDHRSFKPREVNGYPKKDIATYWDCEDYPKSWGHGLKHNPLPKSSVPRERPPMTDATWFKTKTKIPRPPKAMVPVPHTGLKTLHMDSYMRPSDIRMKASHYCPVDTPWTLPDPGPRSVMTAPKMYTTEYQHIGSRKPITV